MNNFNLSPSSKCSFTLFTTDKRVSDTAWVSATDMSISRQTVEKANDIICRHFTVTEEWDKNLLKCVFLSDSQTDLDWFEFNKIAEPHLTLGVKIVNKHIIFKNALDEVYKPLDTNTCKMYKISASVKSVTGAKTIGHENFELTYEQMSQVSGDFSAVALFNSPYFYRMTECSTSLSFSRSLEKIGLSKL